MLLPSGIWLNCMALSSTVRIIAFLYVWINELSENQEIKRDGIEALFQGRGEIPREIEGILSWL